LTSNRPYRKAYSKNSAMKILARESGTKFDPQVTAAFLEILGR
jgi:HD-GYP domain-containing protein (c-di-GMP phosphodiesterase class II)